MKTIKPNKNERSSVVWPPHVRKLIKKAAKDECRKEADLIRVIVMAWLKEKKYA